MTVFYPDFMVHKEGIKFRFNRNNGKNKNPYPVAKQHLEIRFIGPDWPGYLFYSELNNINPHYEKAVTRWIDQFDMHKALCRLTNISAPGYILQIDFCINDPEIKLIKQGSVLDYFLLSENTAMGIYDRTIACIKTEAVNPQQPKQKEDCQMCLDGPDYFAPVENTNRKEALSEPGPDQGKKKKITIERDGMSIAVTTPDGGAYTVHESEFQEFVRAKLPDFIFGL